MNFHIILQCLLVNIAYSLSQKPILIIVSYDAFRYDFLSTKNVSHMTRLRKLGTYADYLINVFPTKTFPNHYSIATGLYPEVHGVVGNSYYNKSTKEIVRIGYEMFHYNDEIVPLWRHNEDEGTGRYSGVMMWPGGCYPYQGKNVTYCKEYDPTFDFYKRIDMVIQWLKDPRKPANLVMVYIEEPDTHAHKYGITSEVVDGLIRNLDNVTQYLEQQLEINDLKDTTHVVHLSDHGMLDVKPPNFINVTQYLKPDTYTYAGSSPVLQFHPKEGYENEVYQKLKNGSMQNGHFKVYKKEEYLSRWHYANNDRSPPVLVVADVGYALDDLIYYSTKAAARYNLTVTNSSTFGIHGYDFTEERMHPFFMARGPKIKANHKVVPFNIVDLLNLFCVILEISSPKNNGSVENIADVLITQNGKYSLATILTFTAGSIVVGIILISCAAVLTLMMIKRQQSITTTAALNKRFPQTFQSSIEAQHLLESDEA